MFERDGIILNLEYVPWLIFHGSYSYYVLYIYFFFKVFSNWSFFFLCTLGVTTLTYISTWYWNSAYQISKLIIHVFIDVTFKDFPQIILFPILISSLMWIRVSARGGPRWFWGLGPVGTRTKNIFYYLHPPINVSRP